jgi:hypothetical protein
VSGAPFRVVPLDAAAHDRSAFASSSAPLDCYLRVMERRNQASPESAYSGRLRLTSLQ